MMNPFAENIRALRKALELTQEEMAFQIGVARQTYSSIEAGRDISVSRICSIAKALRVEVYQLFLPQGPFSCVEDIAHCRAILEKAIGSVTISTLPASCTEISIDKVEVLSLYNFAAVFGE